MPPLQLQEGHCGLARSPAPLCQWGCGLKKLSRNLWVWHQNNCMYWFPLEISCCRVTFASPTLEISRQDKSSLVYCYTSKKLKKNNKKIIPAFGANVFSLPMWNVIIIYHWFPVIHCCGMGRIQCPLQGTGVFPLTPVGLGLGCPFQCPKAIKAIRLCGCVCVHYHANQNKAKTNATGGILCSHSRGI